MNTSLTSTISRFVSTNKSVALELRGVYTCVVDSRATKIDVKQAFTTLYGVEVVQVNISQMREKFHNTKNGIQIKRAPYTKAIVTLKEGQRINDFGVLHK
jgi:large subunit ribosomal protein L23